MLYDFRYLRHSKKNLLEPQLPPVSSSDNITRIATNRSSSTLTHPQTSKSCHFAVRPVLNWFILWVSDHNKSQNLRACRNLFTSGTALYIEKEVTILGNYRRPGLFPPCNQSSSAPAPLMPPLLQLSSYKLAQRFPGVSPPFKKSSSLPASLPPPLMQLSSTVLTQRLLARCSLWNRSPSDL